MADHNQIYINTQIDPQLKSLYQLFAIKLELTNKSKGSENVFIFIWEFLLFEKYLIKFTVYKLNFSIISFSKKLINISA